MDFTKYSAIQNAVGRDGTTILSFLSACGDKLDGYESDHHAVIEYFGITVDQYEKALGYAPITDRTEEELRALPDEHSAK